jgi:hypothetical protein
VVEPGRIELPTSSLRMRRCLGQEGRAAGHASLNAAATANEHLNRGAAVGEGSAWDPDGLGFGGRSVGRPGEGLAPRGGDRFLFRYRGLGGWNSGARRDWGPCDRIATGAARRHLGATLRLRGDTADFPFSRFRFRDFFFALFGAG